MRPLFLPSVLAPWGQCWTQDPQIPGNPWPLRILHHPASCEPRCLTAFSSWGKSETQKGKPRKNVQIPTDMDCWTFTQNYTNMRSQNYIFVVFAKDISCPCVFLYWSNVYIVGMGSCLLYNIQMIQFQSPDAPGAGCLHVLSTHQGIRRGAFPPHSPPSASICKFEEEK